MRETAARHEKTRAKAQKRTARHRSKNGNCKDQRVRKNEKQNEIPNKTPAEPNRKKTGQKKKRAERPYEKDPA